MAFKAFKRVKARLRGMILNNKQVQGSDNLATTKQNSFLI